MLVIYTEIEFFKTRAEPANLGVVVGIPLTFILLILVGIGVVALILLYRWWR